MMLRRQQSPQAKPHNAKQTDEGDFDPRNLQTSVAARPRNALPSSGAVMIAIRANRSSGGHRHGDSKLLAAAHFSIPIFAGDIPRTRL
jgi:hypothetical protein